MLRWHATSNPQPMLPGSADCVFGKISYVRRDEQASKSDRREAP
jgi:hypothetical protein